MHDGPTPMLRTAGSSFTSVWAYVVVEMPAPAQNDTRHHQQPANGATSATCESWLGDKVEPCESRSASAICQ